MENIDINLCLLAVREEMVRKRYQACKEVKSVNKRKKSGSRPFYSDSALGQSKASQVGRDSPLNRGRHSGGEYSNHYNILLSTSNLNLGGPANSDGHMHSLCAIGRLSCKGLGLRILGMKEIVIKDEAKLRNICSHQGGLAEYRSLSTQPPPRAQRCRQQPPRSPSPEQQDPREPR